MFFKKVWAWLKNYWYVPALLIYTIALWVFFRKSNTNLIKVLDIAKESYQKEIEAIKLAHEKELERREEIVLVYQETLKNLEKEHNIKVDELSSKKQEEIQKLVSEHKNDPAALAEEMKRLFGI